MAEVGVIITEYKEEKAEETNTSLTFIASAAPRPCICYEQSQQQDWTAQKTKYDIKDTVMMVRIIIDWNNISRAGTISPVECFEVSKTHLRNSWSEQRSAWRGKHLDDAELKHSLFYPG